MARGRHRRSGLLSRLRRQALPRHRRSRVALLEDEAARLRALTRATAATATAALLRAAGARDAALAAELRAVTAEAGLAAAREELIDLRSDLAALREELVWAFAARKEDVDAAAAPTVIDLREGTVSTA